MKAVKRIKRQLESINSFWSCFFMGREVPEMELIEMIKVPLTKNFFKQSTGIFGLSPVQLFFSVLWYLIYPIWANRSVR